MIRTKLVRGMVALFMAFTFISTASITMAPTTHAVASSAECSDRFLTFPAWYRGLTDSSCSLKSPSDLPGNDDTKLQRYILRIVLNVIEIGLQLVAYISVGFIIYGGFKYLTTASDSNKIAGGRKTIQNALIGLVIAFASIAIVNLIAGNIL